MHVLCRQAKETIKTHLLYVFHGEVQGVLGGYCPARRLHISADTELSSKKTKQHNQELPSQYSTFPSNTFFLRLQKQQRHRLSLGNIISWRLNYDSSQLAG